VSCCSIRTSRDYRVLLPKSEVDAAELLPRDEDRCLFITSRALIRAVLSKICDVHPNALSFERDQNGRPRLTERFASRAPCFNLSHTTGMVVCALAWESEVGVDVENWHRQLKHVQLAQRFFSQNEADTIRSTVSGLRPVYFCKLWTLKEAYAKARGLGLAVPFDQICFNVWDGNGIEAHFSPKLSEHPSEWQFAVAEPSACHIAAVAVHRPNPKPYIFRFERLDHLEQFWG
jgi:4'-phosphopantetheinyl transferase